MQSICSILRGLASLMLFVLVTSSETALANEFPVSGTAAIKAHAAVTFSCDGLGGALFKFNGNGTSTPVQATFASGSREHNYPVNLVWGLTFGNLTQHSISTGMVNPNLSAKFVDRNGADLSEEVSLGACSSGSAMFDPTTRLVPTSATLSVEPAQHRCGSQQVFYVSESVVFAEGVVLKVKFTEDDEVFEWNKPIVGAGREVFSLLAFLGTNVNGNAMDATYTIAPSGTAVVGPCKNTLN